MSNNLEYTLGKFTFKVTAEYTNLEVFLLCYLLKF